jgi:hypothetical protein
MFGQDGSSMGHVIGRLPIRAGIKMQEKARNEPIVVFELEAVFGAMHFQH